MFLDICCMEGTHVLGHLLAGSYIPMFFVVGRVPMFLDISR